MSTHSDKPPGYQIRFALADNGRRHAHVFIAAESEKSQANIRHRMKLLQLHGDPHNETVFRHEGDGIWVLKSGNVRLFCYRKGDDLFFTHGWTKKQQKLDCKQLARAKRIRDENESREEKNG